MRRLILVLCLLAAPVFAVEPDEILDDPVLEERARALSLGLRCLVCRNESIDASSAELAKDLRILVRERMLAGDTDEEAIDFIVERYGEYVLLRPDARGANMILWLAGPAMLVLAALIAGLYIRKRGQAAPETTAGLSEAEEARLKDILDQS